MTNRFYWLNKWAADGGIVQPRNNRIAVLGPSHAANHFNISTDSTGAIAKPSASAQGPVNWANFLSGGRAVLEAEDCFGYNGDWSAANTWNSVSYPGILSRTDAAIASGAGHIVLVAPTANDRNNWSAAQSIANLDAIIGKITSAGILLTILMDYPHGEATFGTTMDLASTALNPQLDYWQRVNRYLACLNNQRGVWVVDVPAILADYTSGYGRMRNGLSVEGLHLNQIGAYLIGRVLARRWRQIYPAFMGLPFGNAEKQNVSGANPNVLQSLNPYFGGTTGIFNAGGSGTLGDSWQSGTSSTGIAMAFSKVTTTSFNGRTYADDGDGPPSKDWQQIILSGNATGNAEQMLLRQSVACTANDILRAAAEIEVDAGVTGISGIYLYVWQAAGSPPDYNQARTLAIPSPAAAFVWPNYPIAGVMRTPKWMNESTQYHLTLVARPITGAPVAVTIRVRGFGASKGLV